MRTVTGRSSVPPVEARRAASIACWAMSPCALAVNASASASKVVDSAWARRARTLASTGWSRSGPSPVRVITASDAPGGGMSTSILGNRTTRRRRPVSSSTKSAWSRSPSARQRGDPPRRSGRAVCAELVELGRPPRVDLGHRVRGTLGVDEHDHEAGLGDGARAARLRAAPRPAASPATRRHAAPRTGAAPPRAR